MTATREPPSETVKLCKDCRHARTWWLSWIVPPFRPWDMAECDRSGGVIIDKVNGRVTRYREGCEYQRRDPWMNDATDDRCGPTGRYHQPKTEGERG
jgi:hypothetical protein